MKIACGIATVLFLASAAVQINDFTQYQNADWWSWMLFYVGTAALSFCVGWGYTKSLPLVTGFGGFALGSFIFRMQDEFGNFQFEKFGGNWFRDEKDMIQQTNEAGGLFIVAVWLFILAFLLKKQQKGVKQDASES